MRFQQEGFAVVFNEAYEMFGEHFREVGEHRELPLDPDIETYVALEVAGSLAIYTARNNEGRLVGYTFWILTNSTHRRTVMVAQQDLFYVDPAHRGYWVVGFVKWMDNALRDTGIRLAIHTVTLTRDFGRVLERAGYVHSDKLYTKRLDA